MSNLLDYFGATYLINLPERKDRLKTAKAELARVGWTLGPGGVQLYAARKFEDRAGFPGNPSVRGCFHSHLECIRTAHIIRQKSILLMEDDIALAPFNSPINTINRFTAGIRRLGISAYFGHEHAGEIATSQFAHYKSQPSTDFNVGIITAHLLRISMVRIFR